MKQLCSTLPPPNIITYSIHEPGNIPPGFSFLPAAEINASRNKVKLLTYNLPQNPLDKYDSGVITLHELVNEPFEPWEQVDESQHSLLAIALQTAAGGIPTPHVVTGAGCSSSDLPWNDNDKKKSKDRNQKAEIAIICIM